MELLHRLAVLHKGHDRIGKERGVPGSRKQRIICDGFRFSGIADPVDTAIGGTAGRGREIVLANLPLICTAYRSCTLRRSIDGNKRIRPGHSLRTTRNAADVVFSGQIDAGETVCDRPGGVSGNPADIIPLRALDRTAAHTAADPSIIHVAGNSADAGVLSRHRSVVLTIHDDGIDEVLRAL